MKNPQQQSCNGTGPDCAASLTKLVASDLTAMYNIEDWTTYYINYKLQRLK